MKRPLLVTFTLLVTLMAPDTSGGKLETPFQMPPHGKPELLLGSTGFEAPTAMAFDSKNRPYLLNNRNTGSYGQLRTIRDGQWITLSMLDALDDARRPSGRNMKAYGEIVIDENDCIYATISGQLVYSADQGKTFRAYSIDGEGSLELRTGPTPFLRPPAICIQTDSRYIDRGERREEEMAWWAKRGHLSVLLPTRQEDGLSLGEPVLISENCLAAGSGGHSGGTSFAVTIGRKTHVVYAEVPDNVREGGNPIHIATVDRETRKVVARSFLMTAPPIKADVHTRPTITADSKGYLHILSGSHGQPFLYLRSLKPNDITGGWTRPVELSGEQCYASIVCDGGDRLHSVFREWIPHASLGYSSACAHDGKWSRPATLVHGANPRGIYEYGIFYHRLSLDRASNLYLSFTFLEFDTGEQGDYPEVLAVSRDRGRSWQLVGAEDFLPD